MRDRAMPSLSTMALPSKFESMPESVQSEAGNNRAKKEASKEGDRSACGCYSQLMPPTFNNSSAYSTYLHFGQFCIMPIQYGEPSDAGNLPNLDASFMVERIGEPGHLVSGFRVSHWV